MNRGELTALTLKGLSAWLVLSGLIWYLGAWLITALFPVTQSVIMLLAPELSSSLHVIESSPGQLNQFVELSAWTLRPIYLNDNQFIAPQTELKVKANLLHVMVPLVIQGSILLVWPVQRLSQRLLLIALGVLTAILVIMAVLPAQLLGNLEISFQDVAITGKNPRAVPGFLDWMVFCELGGRWLLAVASAWLCIQLQRWLLPN
ncbi:MAG: hypothetical protein ABL925_02195 [Methylococcales bacterium]